MNDIDWDLDDVDGLDELSSLYQETRLEQPPLALDRRVLQAVQVDLAEQASPPGAAQRSRGVKPAFSSGLALVAVLVLAVGVVTLMRQEGALSPHVEPLAVFSPPADPAPTRASPSADDTRFDNGDSFTTREDSSHQEVAAVASDEALESPTVDSAAPSEAASRAPSVPLLSAAPEAASLPQSVQETAPSVAARTANLVPQPRPRPQSSPDVVATSQLAESYPDVAADADAEMAAPLAHSRTESATPKESRRQGLELVVDPELDIPARMLADEATAADMEMSTETALETETTQDLASLDSAEGMATDTLGGPSAVLGVDSDISPVWEEDTLSDTAASVVEEGSASTGGESLTQPPSWPYRLNLTVDGQQRGWRIDPRFPEAWLRIIADLRRQGRLAEMQELLLDHWRTMIRQLEDDGYESLAEAQRQLLQREFPDQLPAE